jgi:hypothetical protein
MEGEEDGGRGRGMKYQEDGGTREGNEIPR